VIKGTINEFPAFSFTLADLHGHVMAIPFSLLALAFGLQVATSGPSPPPARFPAALELVCAAIAIGTLYAINAWSFPVIAGLVALCAVVRARDAPSVRERARTLAWMAVLLLLAVLAVLPFLLSYDAAADGLGERDEAGRLLVLGDRPRRRSTGCSRSWPHGLPGGADPLAPPVADGGVDAAVARVRGSLLRRPTSPASRCWPRCAGSRPTARSSTARRRPSASRGPDRRRAAVPADPGGRLRARLVRRHRPVPHEHGLQARLPRVAAAGDRGAPAIVWSWGWLRRRARIASSRGDPAAALLALAAVYPVAGTYARKGGFSAAPHLDGLRWLTESAPATRGDRVAARPRAARLGRARGGRRRLLRLRPRRISSFTGLPDRDGVDRPRAPVGARPRQPPPGRRADLPGHDRGGAAAARQVRRAHTSSSGRSSARPTATRAWRSGTRSAAACTTATAPPVWELK
jgi:hypothetical protein